MTPLEREIAYRAQFCQEPKKACRAGGLVNFAKIYPEYSTNPETWHANYGSPCVTGWMGEFGVIKNCVYCGRPA